MRTEGRDVNLDQVTPHVVHPGLHQDYDLDFQMQRVDDIAPTLTSPMLSRFVSSVRFLGRPEVPRGPASPRWKRACGVPVELPLGQMHQAPHALAGLHLMCEWPKWRPRGTSCMSREGLTLTKPSLGLTQRMQLLLSYQMTTRLVSPLICLRLSLHQKLNRPGARSDPWRTGVHAHLLQRSRLQKKRRRVRLLVKPFYPKGCRRKTSSPRGMKSLPRITTGSSA